MERLLLLIIFLFASSAWSATYYIDFASGNDSNAGTSTGAPWKTIPGTRNAGDSGWQSTDWGSGTINSSNKVPAGTVFKLKSGTTHSSSTGGKILFDSTYYLSNYSLENPVIIQRDSTWGSGAVTFDGTGITTGGGGYGILMFRYGGIRIDGVSTDGIVVQDSTHNGISHYSTSHTTGIDVMHCKLYNNGTSYSGDSGNAAGQLYLFNVTGGTIQYCNFDGNGRSINGLKTADIGSMYVDDLTVDHCNSYDHYGSDDCGMGFKFHSTTVTVSNCTSHDNWKGADNGAKNSAFNPVMKYINNLIYDNNENGINYNGGTAIGVSSTLTIYFINNVVYNNARRGISGYDGKMHIYMVHNTIVGNGNSEAAGNIGIMNNDDPLEGSEIIAYIYNNIFYKPINGAPNLFNGVWGLNTSPPSDLTIYADYNSWVQNSTEYHSRWGYYGGVSDNAGNFSYGSNGPGHSSGNYYNYYGGTANAPSNGSLGHYHNDAHSKGTGAADTTLPPFTDVGNHDYTLTQSYAGTNISGESWYISEMGTDILGNTRTNWDMGSYEYEDGGPPSAPKNLLLHVFTQKGNNIFDILIWNTNY